MGKSPLVASAIHQGHHVRPEIEELLVINENERLREEDPFTGLFAEILENRIIVNTSRFEVDLNRPRQKAVYKTPEDAWGLNVWKKQLPEEVINYSLGLYDNFYNEVFQFLKQLENEYGRFIILDLHSYCHRRNGPDSAPQSAEKNPQINVGTGTMNRRFWAKIVSRFIFEIKSYDFLGQNIDIRENIRFTGGYFSRWVHETFPKTGCCLAIEIKKTFMDEWTGLIDENVFREINNALKSAIPGLKEEINKFQG